MGSLHGQKTRPALQGRPQSPSYFLSRSKTHFRGQHTSYVRSTGNVDTTAASISSNPVQLGVATRGSRRRTVSRGRNNLSASTDCSKLIPAQRHGQIPPRFGPAKGAGFWTRRRAQGAPSTAASDGPAARLHRPAEAPHRDSPRVPMTWLTFLDFA